MSARPQERGVAAPIRERHLDPAAHRLLELPRTMTPAGGPLFKEPRCHTVAQSCGEWREAERSRMCSCRRPS